MSERRGLRRGGGARVAPGRLGARVAVAGVVGAVGVVLAVGALRVVSRGIRLHPYFTVRGLEVTGVRRVPAAEITARVAVPLGTNTWEVDLAAARVRVLEHPWIAGATVRRLLPDRVRIHVREREPVGIVPIAGRPWAIDRRGRPVAPWTPTPAARLPLIAGVDLPAAAPLDVAAARMLRRVTGLLRALAGGHEVADLRIDAATGVTVRTRALGDVPIEFGWGHWERKRERFDAVMASWVGREADLRAVSVAIDDHVIVRLRPGAAAPPKPGGDAA